MACEKEQEQYEKAIEATQNAELAFQSAVANKDAAAYALGAAMGSTVVCLSSLLAPPLIGIPLVIICEAAAILAIESALEWLESAIPAMELAEKARDAALDAEDQAGDALEECLNLRAGATPHLPGVTDEMLAAIREQIEEAEGALAESAAFEDETESLLAEAEEAAEELEEAIAEAEELEETDEELIA